MTKDTIAMLILVVGIILAAVYGFKSQQNGWHQEPPVMPSTTLDATK
jgi:hypothetical protein